MNEEEKVNPEREAKPHNGPLTVSSLQWKPIEATATDPEIVCDQCQKKNPANGQLAAQVPIQAGISLSIVMCSDLCLRNFKNRKNIDRIVRESVNSARKKLRMQAIKMMGK